MRSIYHSVGRCFFAVHLLVTMTKSALGPRLGFRGYPKVNTLGVKCFRRKVYATLGVSCYLIPITIVRRTGMVFCLSEIQ